MTVTIPDSHLPLLTGPVYAVLTTIAPDGQPENSVEIGRASCRERVSSVV